MPTVEGKSLENVTTSMSESLAADELDSAPKQESLPTVESFTTDNVDNAAEGEAGEASTYVGEHASAAQEEESVPKPTDSAFSSACEPSVILEDIPMDIDEDSDELLETSIVLGSQELPVMPSAPQCLVAAVTVTGSAQSATAGAEGVLQGTGENTTTTNLQAGCQSSNVFITNATVSGQVAEPAVCSATAACGNNMSSANCTSVPSQVLTTTASIILSSQAAKESSGDKAGATKFSPIPLPPMPPIYALSNFNINFGAKSITSAAPSTTVAASRVTSYQSLSTPGTMASPPVPCLSLSENVAATNAPCPSLPLESIPLPALPALPTPDDGASMAPATPSTTAVTCSDCGPATMSTTTSRSVTLPAKVKPNPPIGIASVFRTPNPNQLSTDPSSNSSPATDAVAETVVPSKDRSNCDKSTKVSNSAPDKPADVVTPSLLSQIADTLSAINSIVAPAIAPPPTKFARKSISKKEPHKLSIHKRKSTKLTSEKSSCKRSKSAEDCLVSMNAESAVSEQRKKSNTTVLRKKKMSSKTHADGISVKKMTMPSSVSKVKGSAELAISDGSSKDILSEVKPSTQIVSLKSKLSTLNLKHSVTKADRITAVASAVAEPSPLMGSEPNQKLELANTKSSSSAASRLESAKPTPSQVCGSIDTSKGIEQLSDDALQARLAFLKTLVKAAPVKPKPETHVAEQMPANLNPPTVSNKTKEIMHQNATSVDVNTAYHDMEGLPVDNVVAAAETSSEVFNSKSSEEFEISEKQAPLPEFGVDEEMTRNYANEDFMSDIAEDNTMQDEFSEGNASFFVNIASGSCNQQGYVDTGSSFQGIPGLAVAGGSSELIPGLTAVDQG